jgi:hypothetical protein
MSQLPAAWPVQAALVWIATRSIEACLEVFETEDDKEAAMRVKDFGLTTVAFVVAKHRRPGLLTVKDKKAKVEVLDTGCVRTTRKKQSSPTDDYEFFNEAKELLEALVKGDIIARTTATGVPACEIDAIFWQGREFQDEERGGHYHVIAEAPGHEPLREIFFKASDVRQMWPGALGASKLEVLTPQEQVAEVNHKKRGSSPIKRKAVEAAMIKDVRDGQLTRDGLRGMLEKTMVARYDVSRDTARKARNNALGQLDAE